MEWFVEQRSPGIARQADPQSRVEQRAWADMAPKRTAALTTGAVLCLLAAGALGYVAGSSQGRVTIHSGMSHSGLVEVSVTGEDGWVYSIPLDVNWTDATGVQHAGERPACLPPSGQVVGPIRFAATDAEVDGARSRVVVWVWCT